MDTHAAAPTQRSTATRVVDYYHSTESRLGYRLLLGGTKHFGFYEPGQSRWQFRRAMRQMEDQLAEWLGQETGAKVLDGGAGMGDVACRLAGVHGLDVTGVDLLDFNVVEARRRADERDVADRCRFVQADYTDLDLPTASFDAVYTMETLVHVADVDAALATFHRLLRPGGRLVLVEYQHLGADLIPASAAAFDEINELAAMPGFAQFGPGVLTSKMVAAGFADVDETDVTDRMLPMLSAFRTMARGPFGLVCALGLRHKAVNAMSAVEFHRHLGQWSYRVHTARKPT
jgi:sterol 24-C-methyltransferase